MLWFWISFFTVLFIFGPYCSDVLLKSIKSGLRHFTNTFARKSSIAQIPHRIFCFCHLLFPGQKLRCIFSSILESHSNKVYGSAVWLFAVTKFSLKNEKWLKRTFSDWPRLAQCPSKKCCTSTSLSIYPFYWIQILPNFINVILFYQCHPILPFLPVGLSMYTRGQRQRWSLSGLLQVGQVRQLLITVVSLCSR